MENHHFQWENPLYMAIFNSYVKLPEGTQKKINSRITGHMFMSKLAIFWRPDIFEIQRHLQEISGIRCVCFAGK